MGEVHGYLIGDVRPPGVDLESIAPAGAPVKPRAVFVGYGAVFHPRGAAQRRSWLINSAGDIKDKTTSTRTNPHPALKRTAIVEFWLGESFSPAESNVRVLLKALLNRKWCEVMQNSPHLLLSLPWAVITAYSSTWRLEGEQVTAETPAPTGSTVKRQQSVRKRAFTFLADAGTKNPMGLYLSL